VISPSYASCPGLSPVVSVDLDVIFAEIAGPATGGNLPSAQFDPEEDLLSLEVFSGLCFIFRKRVVFFVEADVSDADPHFTGVQGNTGPTGCR